jgi:iron complex outermembrane receptor protein
MARLSYGTLAAALAAILGSTATAQQIVEEIHVTGTPLESSPDELAQSVTVYSGETLERIRAANLGETLAGQLGITASFFGAGSSRPIIRGLAGARVRTMEDGIDSMDVSTVSIDHAVSIDPLVAQQIEVFRGPTTLLYGSGAVGGVVNTVTNRIPESAPDDGFDGRLELRGDSVADDRTLAIALDGGTDRIAWHFDAMTRETEDYEIPGFAEAEGLEEDHEEEEGEEHEEEEVFGIAENSNLDIDTAAAGVSWLGDNSFFGVSVSTFDTNYGLPGHGHHEHHEEGEEEEEEHEEEEEIVRIDLEQTRVDLKGGWLGVSDGIQAINLRFGINEYEHVELEGEEIGTRFSNDAWEGRLEFVHAPWGRWNGAFGLQLSEREFSAIGAEAFVPPVDTSTQGIFLVEETETENWRFSLGGRIEQQDQDPSFGGPSLSDTATSFSAAGIRDFGNGVSLAINFARAERLPVAEELYAFGPHLASDQIELGDASIGTETSNHFDIGLRGVHGDLTWGVTAFVTRYDDFIYLRDTGDLGEDRGFDDEGAELAVFEFTQQDADLTGLEVELFTPIANFGDTEIDLRVFGDYVDGELANGDYLPRIPPLRVGAQMQFHNERMLAGFEVTRYDAQEDLAQFETRTGAYTMFNADFNWTHALSDGRTLNFFLRGTNLLDEEARRHSSFIKDLAPLPGRNYSIGFRVAL